MKNSQGPKISTLLCAFLFFASCLSAVYAGLYTKSPGLHKQGNGLYSAGSGLYKKGSGLYQPTWTFPAPSTLMI